MRYITTTTTTESRVKENGNGTIEKYLMGLRSPPHFLLRTGSIKNREVSQSPIYVIVHSLLELSFAHNHFRTIADGCRSYGFWHLHMKGREWKVGTKDRSTGLLLKDWIGRGVKREGRGRDEREKKGRGAACILTIKSLSPALASKHQFGRPVKMLQTSWPLMGFTIRQMQSSRKFQSQEQSYQCQRHPPRLLLRRPR